MNKLMPHGDRDGHSQPLANVMKVAKWALFFLLGLLTQVVFAVQGVDAERSEISFGFRQQGVPGGGKFLKFSAQAVFLPAKPESTQARVDIDMTSVELGDKGWNQDIQSAAWFDSRQFPISSVVVAGAKMVSPGRYEAPGKLTLKGATHDVVVSFRSRSEGAALVLEGEVPLKRVQFKIGDGAWADTSVVANEVSVRFKLVFKK